MVIFKWIAINIIHHDTNISDHKGILLRDIAQRFLVSLDLIEVGKCCGSSKDIMGQNNGLLASAPNLGFELRESCDRYSSFKG